MTEQQQFVVKLNWWSKDASLKVRGKQGKNQPREAFCGQNKPQRPNSETTPEEGNKFNWTKLYRNLWSSSVQFSFSVASNSLWSHGLQHARLPCPSPTPGLLKLVSLESVMPSRHLILCRPLLLPSIFPSIRVFSNESALLIRWPKDCSFSFSISPSNEYSGLISFRIDGLDLFAVQGTLKSLLQHRSSKASILRCSVFFIVQPHTHIWLLKKNHSFDYTDLCWQSNVSTF